LGCWHRRHLAEPAARHRRAAQVGAVFDPADDVLFRPADELIDELCRAAKAAQVRVRLMLPGNAMSCRCCGQAVRLRPLVSAGVEVYERQGAVLHAKTM